jgi:HPt (histidine-containing phosphotransfer) domain-containing protein
MEIAAAGTDQKRLRSIAKKLLEKAEEGDMQAIAMVADRLDGKPTQAHEHSGSIGRYDVTKATDEQLDQLENILGGLAESGGDPNGETPTEH